MRQAQKILMIIAAVVSIIVTVIFAAIVIPTAIAAAARVEGGEPFPTGVIVFFIIAGASFINIILSFMGKNSKSGVVLVLNIIFGILSDIFLNAVGAILGLIANGQGK